MSVDVVFLASEFPNDNPALHGGVIWVCLEPTAPPTPELVPPRPTLVARTIATSDTLAETVVPPLVDEAPPTNIDVMPAVVEEAAVTLVPPTTIDATSDAGFDMEIEAPTANLRETPNERGGQPSAADTAMIAEAFVVSSASSTDAVRAKADEALAPFEAEAVALAEAAAAVEAVASCADAAPAVDAVASCAEDDELLVVEELTPIDPALVVEAAGPSVVFDTVPPPTADDSSALPPPSDDPFTTLVCTLADVAIGAGSPHVASLLPALMLDARVPDVLDEATAAALKAAGIWNGESVEPAFVETVSAWRGILRGTSDDFSACSAMLDEWTSDLLARLLDAQASAPRLRQELRTRGVAAFGLA